jgi:uncharacterized Fe-S cluster protein YjdI
MAKREEVMKAAYSAHPERFVRGTPRVPQVPQAVWINPPTVQTVERVVVAAIETDPTIQVLPSGGSGSKGNSGAALDADPPDGDAESDEVRFSGRPRICTLN